MLQVPHLDRDFDYSSPPSIPTTRSPVCGFGPLPREALDALHHRRRSETDHVGKARLAGQRWVSSEQVLTPTCAVSSTPVAARYAAPVPTWLRWRCRRRHANVEKQAVAGLPHWCDGVDRRGGRRTDAVSNSRCAGRGTCRHARCGRRAGGSWADRLAEAGGRGERGRGRSSSCRTSVTSDTLARRRGRHVDEASVVARRRPRASERLPPVACRIARSRPLVIGTRSAVFARVADLGL